TFEDAIAKLVLRDMLERQEEEEDADRVQLMTMHASKGLEYPHVYVMGMEEEILPHRSSIEADTVDEERRLAYVAITRAKRNLTFTFAARRRQFGEIIDCLPSRFLDELPQEDLEWEGTEDVTVEQKQARGNSALDDIRILLCRYPRSAATTLPLPLWKRAGERGKQKKPPNQAASSSLQHSSVEGQNPLSQLGSFLVVDSVRRHRD